MSFNYQYSHQWLLDDGINFPMILDANRNKFYDKMLRENVKDQKCVDIGFGTGILSMIALKHGAKHILAFEADLARFLLGEEIISRLGLQDKIQLIHGKFHKGMAHLVEGRKIFHELVNPCIWGEGLYYCMDERFDMMPNEYHFSIQAYSDSDICQTRNDQSLERLLSNYNAVRDSSWPTVESISDYENLPQAILDEITHDHKLYYHLPYTDLNNFIADFGVEIDQSWQDLLMRIALDGIKKTKVFGRAHLDRSQTLRLINESENIGNIVVQANTMQTKVIIDQTEQLIDIANRTDLRIILPKTKLPKSNCVISLIPKVVHDDHQLTLLTLESGDCWGNPMTFTIDSLSDDIELYIDLSAGKHRISPL